MRGKMIAGAAALLTTVGVAGAGVASAASPSIPTATPLHFARGATSTDVRGHVAAGGDVRYTFQARAGQTATFHLARSTSAMTWTLVGPTGPSVHNAHSPRQSDFTYTLPQSGTYYVDIVSSRQASYDLSLSIPATGSSSSAIAFAPGATSATVKGSGSHSYTFGANAGQTATVHFTDSSSRGAWTLVAPGGSPLHTTMTEQQRDVTVKLPSSGDYRLDVQAPAGSRYTVTLSIPGSGGGTAPASGSSTIAFAPGATSATVKGSGSHSYTFGANAGQTATVHFTDSSSRGAWTLVAPGGSPLHTTMTEQQRDVTVKLPSSGDYRLDVQAPAGSRYTVTLSIPRG